MFLACLGAAAASVIPGEEVMARPTCVPLRVNQFHGVMNTDTIITVGGEGYVRVRRYEFSIEFNRGWESKAEVNAEVAKTRAAYYMTDTPPGFLVVSADCQFSQDGLRATGTRTLHQIFPGTN